MSTLRRISVLSVSVALWGGFAATPVLALDATGLYDTGPAQDASFVRFVNGTDEKVAITNSKNKGKVELSTQGAARVSLFLPIKAGAKLSANVVVGGKTLPLELVAKPSEFITVATVPSGPGAFKTMVLREQPTEFNALRASVAVFNFDANCASAEVNSAGKTDGIFKNATSQAIQRRAVNPIKAQVQWACAGKPLGTALDMGSLQAGERYSIFLLPAKQVSLAVQDELGAGK
jgi:alginate O-acetyltransferase complex protein AlgF